MKLEEGEEDTEVDVGGDLDGRGRKSRSGQLQVRNPDMIDLSYLIQETVLTCWVKA